MRFLPLHNNVSVLIQSYIHTHLHTPQTHVDPVLSNAPDLKLSWTETTARCPHWPPRAAQLNAVTLKSALGFGKQKMEPASMNLKSTFKAPVAEGPWSKMS